MVQRLVDAYPISKEGSRAGVVVYNSEAEMKISPNSDSSHENFKNLVRAMPHTIKEPSSIFRALKTGRESLVPTMRKDLPKIIILLTGYGKQAVFDSTALASTLKALRKENVSIMVVSFGLTEKNENLKSIVDSKGSFFHVIDAKNLMEAKFISLLAKQICKLGK